MFNRHDLVWLNPDTAHYSDEVQAWMQAQRPFIVTRQTTTFEKINLACCLPTQDKAKGRIAFIAHQRDIIQHQPPLTLLTVSEKLQHDWLKDLYQAFFKFNFMPQVYGSYAWQTLTGLKYIHDNSDLDLLLAVDTLKVLTLIEEALPELASSASVTLDGEIVFAHTHAVSWKEWLSGSESILCKTNQEVYLCTRPTLHALLK